jgi:glycerate kinase
VRVLAAPDKFRGTVTAREAAAAMCLGATAAGWSCHALPLADGGEGTLDALGGPTRTSVVTGPLGAPVEAGWRLDGERAVLEMSRASGLALAGGEAGDDPVGATTRGTGELVAAAAAAGAREIVVGVGGSATTDGGAGALEAVSHLIRS